VTRCKVATSLAIERKMAAVTPAVTSTVASTVTSTVASTVTPTVAPTVTPTVTSTVTPTVTSTVTPTVTPTVTVTETPTETPTVTPTVGTTVTSTVASTVTQAVTADRNRGSKRKRKAADGRCKHKILRPDEIETLRDELEKLNENTKISAEEVEVKKGELLTLSIQHISILYLHLVYNIYQYYTYT